RRIFFGTSQKEPDTEPIPEGSALQPGIESPQKPQENDSTSGQALKYLERVQEKINKLAEEFATGIINQSQFQELFDHYRREQQTIKRWIHIAPDSDAWKAATTEGKSVLIRAGNVARVVGYAIYENDSGMPLNTIGKFDIDRELVVPMLSSYRAATQEIFGAGMRSSQIEGGQWLCFIPGEFTTLMALFSTSPATRQLNSLEELHKLFELANKNLLNSKLIVPDDLVFPHTFFLGRVE
ncbi:MAG: hypothetical protein IIC78_10845, partial [Chloroflexi bacterium]|nr:hypothetical protein [Chloroflexota bacterium]